MIKLVQFSIKKILVTFLSIGLAITGCSNENSSLPTDSKSSGVEAIEESKGATSYQPTLEEVDTQVQRELLAMQEENCRIANDLNWIMIDVDSTRNNLEWDFSLNYYREVDAFTRNLQTISLNLWQQKLNLCEWNEFETDRGNLAATFAEQKNLRCEIKDQLNWIMIDLNQVERDWEYFLFSNNEIRDYETLDRLRFLSTRLWATMNNLCL